MNLIDDMKRSFLVYAEGSPKLEESVFKGVYDEFSVILYLSCVFLDLRPKYRKFSVVLILTFLTVLITQLWMLTVTVTLQIEDFEAAALSAETAIILLIEIVSVLMFNTYRQDMMGLFRCISDGYFNYNDGVEIPEMRLEIEKSRKQKLFVMIVTPTYLSLTVLVVMSGRTMDSYAGILPNASYVNDVYIMGPIPTWCPFTITDDFGHYALFFSQMLLSGTLACGFSGVIAYFVISAQSIVLQLKVFRFRVRKIHHLAYNLYLKRGGSKRTKGKLFEDTLYRQCYNEYLTKCALHHIAIIKGFNHYLNTSRWIIYFAMVLLSGMFAMTLLLLVLGFKPSVLAIGLMLLADEIVNVSIICWQSEQIQDQSRSLPGELYGTKWIYMGKQASTTLRIMIERCNQPLLLTAAITHTPVNWETYAAVLNTAYSYVNLVAAASKD